VTRMLYSDPSFGVLHDDLLHHSWAPEGNSRANIGTGCGLIDSGYASSYDNYFFCGSSSEFLDD